MEIKNATIVKEARVICDDKIMIHTVKDENDNKIGLVVLLPGEYNFKLGNPEHIEIIAGELEAKLGEDDEFQVYKKGDTFVAEKDKLFAMKVDKTVQYMVTY